MRSISRRRRHWQSPMLSPLLTRRMARIPHRWRRLLRLAFFLLLAYLSVILFIFLVPFWALGHWLPTEKVLFAITPSFTHEFVAMQLFSIVSPSLHNSPFFGQFSQPLSPTEALAESVWVRAQRVSLDPSLDCSNFAAVDSARGVIGLELSEEAADPGGRRPTSEQAVAEALEKAGVRMDPGGFFMPGDCRARETVAIIVPYRDRHDNLIAFLNYMHRFLQRQRRRYLIVVAEQANYNVSFNRAKLFNAAVRELMVRRPHIDCFVLHDVDKLPYHLLNLYACGFQPRQLATAVGSDGGGWSAYYRTFLGGVTAFSRWQLLHMNGASNDFYGWGAEDDEMAMRVALAGYRPTNPGPVRGRFWAMHHHADRKDGPNMLQRLMLSRVIVAMKLDGLQQVSYKRLTLEKRPLYTLLSFHV